jgi:pimeloyl-ACP methyl ester carboxylesterase
MEVRPVTRFVWQGDRGIVYQVFGSGSVDVLLVTTTPYGVDLVWDLPVCAGFLRRLAKFARVVMFDILGTASSDRLAGYRESTLPERWAEQADLVLDAVDSQRAVLLAISEGNGVGCD